MPDTTVKDPDVQSKFKIKVDGQEKEVLVNEKQIIDALQKTEKWTQDMQKLAEQERTLKAEQERIAGMRVIVDEMDADPKLKETLNKVYSDYKSGRIAKPENKDSNLKKLDKLLEDTSDPAQREQLRDIRDIIREETPDTKGLEDKIAKLENELSAVRDAALIGQSDRTESQIERLKGDYGDELVNKHKEEIRSLALKYPRQSVENLLLHLADKSQIRTVLLEQARKKEKEELDRKKRNSSPGGTDTSFTAKTELRKDKAGRVTMDSLKDRILERLGRR